jgi:hypothetical protein
MLEVDFYHQNWGYIKNIGIISPCHALPAPGPLFEYAHLVSTDAPRRVFFVCRCLPSGYVKIAIENGHL